MTVRDELTKMVYQTSDERLWDLAQRAIDEIDALTGHADRLYMHLYALIDHRNVTGHLEPCPDCLTALGLWEEHHHFV